MSDDLLRRIGTNPRSFSRARLTERYIASMAQFLKEVPLCDEPGRDDLRGLWRMSALRQEIEGGQWPDVTDLGTELRNLKHLLCSFAGPEIALEFECNRTPGRLSISPPHVAMILLALLKESVDGMNAFNMGSHRKRIRISCQVGRGCSLLPPQMIPLRSAHLVSLTLRDDGPGIPPELSHVFLNRLSVTPEQLREPSGRNVASARRALGLAEMLTQEGGGLLKCDSIVGYGTRIRIVFPMSSPHLLPHKPRGYAHPAGDADLSNGNAMPQHPLAVQTRLLRPNRPSVFGPFGK